MTFPQPLARNSKIHIKTNLWQQRHQSLSHRVNTTLRRDNPGWKSTGVCAWHQLIILSQRCDGLPRNSAASAQDGQFLAVNVCRMRWVTRGCVHQQNCQGVTHGNVEIRLWLLCHFTALCLMAHRGEISRCEGPPGEKFHLSYEQLDVKFKHHKSIVMDNKRPFWKTRIPFGKAGLHCPVNTNFFSLFMSWNSAWGSQVRWGNISSWCLKFPNNQWCP